MKYFRGFKFLTMNESKKRFNKRLHDDLIILLNLYLKKYNEIYSNYSHNYKKSLSLDQMVGINIEAANSVHAYFIMKETDQVYVRKYLRPYLVDYSINQKYSYYVHPPVSALKQKINQLYQTYCYDRTII